MDAGSIMNRQENLEALFRDGKTVILPIDHGVALRRVGEHHELADLCVYLISDSAAFITGEAVVIDGGRWLQGAAGASAYHMQQWPDSTWDSLRPKKDKA